MSTVSRSGKNDEQKQLFEHLKEVMTEILKTGKFGKLEQPLKEDYPFPDGFNEWMNTPEAQQSKSYQSLLKIHRTRVNFRQSIENGELTAVKSFVEAKENSKLKFCFDPSNEPALVTAFAKLTATNIGIGNAPEIFALLQHNSFQVPSNDFRNKIDALHDITKEKINAARDNLCKSSPTSHTRFILSKCKLGRNYDDSDEKTYMKRIEKWIQKLDAMGEEVSLILKVVQHSGSLSIVFDFDGYDVTGIDVKAGYSDTGRCYIKTGKIRIGTKAKEELVLGWIIHELAHYAMQIVFGNEASPFYESSDEAEKFLRIVDCCKSKTPKIVCTIIANIFATNADQSYKPSDHCSELIVRVPQIFAVFHNKNDKLNTHRKTYSQLFQYYQDKVVLRMKAILSDLHHFESIRRVQTINDSHDLRMNKGIVRRRCRSDESVSNAVTRSIFTVIVSSIPQFTIRNLFPHKKYATNEYILLTTSDLSRSALMDEVQWICKIDEKVKLVLCCNPAYDFPDNYIEQLPPNVLFVCNKSDAKLISKFTSDQIIDDPHIYSLVDVTDEQERNFLQQTINLQDFEIRLEEFFQTAAEMDEVLPLANFFNGNISTLAIQKSELRSYPVYIGRKFKTATGIEISQDFVLRQMMEDKVLLLINDAGMGKSVSGCYITEQLKMKYHSSLTIFIDLRKMTHIFKEHKKFAVDVHLLCARLLKLDTDLQLKFVRHLFDSGKICFVIDGIDEISPDYEHIIVKIIEEIKQTCNCMLVTSRPVVAVKLEQQLNVKAIKLQGFSFDDQVDFIAQVWSKGSGKKDKNAARTLLMSFDKSTATKTQDDFFGYPLHLQMLADIYEEADTIDIKQDHNGHFNLYIFFEAFYRKKNAIWIDGRLAQLENMKINNKSGNIKQFQHKRALEYFFDKKTMDDLATSLQFHKIKDEDIVRGSRLGLFQVDAEKNFWFVHQMFAEYLVVDFVLQNLCNECVIDIFIRILRESRFAMMRKFLNDKFQEPDETDETDETDDEDIDVDIEILKEKLKTKLNCSILLNVVREERIHLMKFILVKLQLDNSTKLRLVQYVNNNYEAALDLTPNRDVFETLWLHIQSFTEDQRRQLISPSNGPSLLDCALNANDLGWTIFIVEIGKELLSEENFIKFLWCYGTNEPLETAMKKSLAFFEGVWCAVKTKFQNRDNLKKAMFLRLRWSLLCEAVQMRRKDMFEFILTLFDTTFTKPELFHIFSHADIMQDASNTIRKRCDTSVMNTLARNPNLGIVQKFWEYLQAKFIDRSELKHIWKQTNRDGSIFIMGMAAISDSLGMKELLKISKIILDDPGEFKDWLTTKTVSGNNILHHVTELSDINFIDILLPELNDVLGKDGLKKFLFEENNDGLNVIQITEKSFVPKFDGLAIESFRKYISIDDLSPFITSGLGRAMLDIDRMLNKPSTFSMEFFNTKYSKRWSTFSIVFSLGTADQIQSLLHIFESLGAEERKKMFFKRESEEVDIFMAAMDNHHPVFDHLWEFTAQFCHGRMLIDVLTQKNNIGMSIVLLILISPRADVLFKNKNYNWLTDNLQSDEELNTFFYTKYDDETILLHDVVRGCTPLIIERYLEMIGVLLGNEKLLEMLKARDKNGKNCLWYFLRKNNVLDVQSVWDNLVRIAPHEHLKELVFDPDVERQYCFNLGRSQNKKLTEFVRTFRQILSVHYGAEYMDSFFF